MQHEAHETFRFLTREVDVTDLAGLPWHRRHPRSLWRFFLAVAFRLSPWRRVLFAFDMSVALCWTGVTTRLVVPLAPPDSDDPTKCRPIGCYVAATTSPPATGRTDDEEEDDDDDDEDLVVFTAKEAAGAMATIYGFVRPYLGNYRKLIAFVTFGVLVETLFNVIMPLSLKFLIDDALGEEDFEALIRILSVLAAARESALKGRGVRLDVQ